ncbi:MAG: hypothetical protein VB858_05145 [Planctomycetaceae bacterium]
MPSRFPHDSTDDEMLFPDFEEEMHFRSGWDSVQIARPVEYSLFTFGASDLPYYLVRQPDQPGGMVSVQRGDVQIARPMILTADTSHPEFRDFFQDDDGDQFISFLLSRTAAFSNLKMTNRCGPEKLVSDNMEEIVAQLNRQLDNEEEDRVAILTAPANLGGLAILKYTTERVLTSAPDNVQELRERGFLP